MLLDYFHHRVAGGDLSRGAIHSRQGGGLHKR
jgi:hypothetical protein